MAQQLYDPSVYDGVPTLNDAGRKFDLKNGEYLVNNKFRELFLQHNVDRVFGLSLLHRHFDLSSNELLVEYGGTSVPWEETLGKTSPYIRPSNWALAEDGIFRPFEFYYCMQDADNDADVPADPKFLSFIQSFENLLHEEGATDLFGLCKYPGDDFKGRIEITEGRANINLDPDDVLVPCPLFIFRSS